MNLAGARYAKGVGPHVFIGTGCERLQRKAGGVHNVDQRFCEDSILGFACRRDIPYGAVSFPLPTEIYVQGAKPSPSSRSCQPKKH